MTSRKHRRTFKYAMRQMQMTISILKFDWAELLESTRSEQINFEQSEEKQIMELLNIKITPENLFNINRLGRP